MSDSNYRGRKLGAYTEGSLTWRVSELEPGDAMLVMQSTPHTRSLCDTAVKTVQKVKLRAVYAVKTFTASDRVGDETFKLIKVERVK